MNENPSNSVSNKPGTPRAPLFTGLRGYGLSAICVVLATLFRLSLDSIWADRFPFVLAFLAVLVVTNFAEAGPTIFASVAGFLLSDWFFVEPRHSLLIESPGVRFNSVIFFFICLVVLLFSIRWRRAVARERAAQVELQEALDNVKALSGLLPICAHCKKIRDDKGYWNQIEHYIRERSEATFTHGMCPECSRKLYPTLFPPDPATGKPQAGKP